MLRLLMLVGASLIILGAIVLVKFKKIHGLILTAIGTVILTASIILALKDILK